MMNSLQFATRFLWSLLPLLSATHGCSLNGTWYYLPEGPTHDYNWSISPEGNLECFEGRDFWKQASGKLVDNNLTLVFGDPARCPGATGQPHMGIVKWGIVDAGCNIVVMHDTQPNCPRQGLCKYVRCPKGTCPTPPLPPSPCPASPTDPLDVDWLSCRARQIIQGCKEPIQANSPLNKGIDASSAYTPDATHSYGAQWTRDFAYAVMGGARLMDEDSVKASVRYTFAGQREDGCMPDRVQIDGMSVMSPGGMMPGNIPNPQHDHAWDNGPFAALLLAATTRAWPERNFFCDLEPLARKALDFVNRSTGLDGNHLVFNAVSRPNCTYGFTDTVAKTGSLLFCSLLYIDASQQMAKLSAKYNCGDADRYAKEANTMAGHVDVAMRDPQGGPLWLAATVDNAYPDVWGSAYLVALNLSTATRRRAAMEELVSQKDTFFRAGQVRHLPYPTVWTRCNFSAGGTGGCPANGTYQNGAYWATPLSYVTAAMLNTGHADFARQLLTEAITNFKQVGIYEDVDDGYPAHSRGVLNYTASVTSVLWSVEMLRSRGD